MSTFASGCLICGKPLQFFGSAKELECAICGGRFLSDAACENGHYICDKCHSEKGVFAITRHALATGQKNPASIAAQMMRDPSIHMHGPEHHYLVAAALLAAYKNAGGDIDLPRAC